MNALFPLLCLFSIFALLVVLILMLRAPNGRETHARGFERLEK